MSPSKQQPVKYAVVGLGHIAQVAVLPAFAHAKRNSRLHALVSSDPEKLGELGDTYGVDVRGTYDDYENCLRDVDAVFIARRTRNTPSSPCAPPTPASTCCARSRWR